MKFNVLGLDAVHGGADPGTQNIYPAFTFKPAAMLTLLYLIQPSQGPRVGYF